MLNTSRSTRITDAAGKSGIWTEVQELGLVPWYSNFQVIYLINATPLATNLRQNACQTIFMNFFISAFLLKFLFALLYVTLSSLFYIFSRLLCAFAWFLRGKKTFFGNNRWYGHKNHCHNITFSVLSGELEKFLRWLRWFARSL